MRRKIPKKMPKGGSFLAKPILIQTSSLMFSYGRLKTWRVFTQIFTFNCYNKKNTLLHPLGCGIMFVPRIMVMINCFGGVLGKCIRDFKRS